MKRRRVRYFVRLSNDFLAAYAASKQFSYVLTDGGDPVGLTQCSHRGVHSVMELVCVSVVHH